MNPLFNKFWSKLKPARISCLFLVFQFFISFNLFSTCVFQGEISAEELKVGNLLTWVTVTEIENEKFIIQKSKDGLLFEDLGILNGAGTSHEENNYRFLDTKIGETVSFYRIVFVDADENHFHTPTIIMDRKTENNFVVTGMSTTATNKDFSLTIRSAIEGEMSVEISGTGDEFIISWDLVRGTNMLAIDLENVELGIYKIALKMGEESEELFIKKVADSEAPQLSFVVKE